MNEAICKAGNIPLLVGVKLKMKPTQAIELVSAPVTSLLLILGLLTFAMPQRGSTGFRIPLLRVASPSHEWHECPDEVIFISLIDGKLRINHDPVPLVELGPRIRHIMEYRAKPVVYVVADASSSYAQFTEILDSVSGAVKNIHIGLISGANQRALDQHVAFFCSLRWPESEFTLSRTRK